MFQPILVEQIRQRDPGTAVIGLLARGIPVQPGMPGQPFSQLVRWPAQPRPLLEIRFQIGGGVTLEKSGAPSTHGAIFPRKHPLGKSAAS